MDYLVFPCPACREMIDTTMQSCRFCGAAIDPGAAAAAATLQQRVQQACGQASSARITAMAMPVLYLLSTFVPLLGCVRLAATAFTLLIVPFSVIQWHWRFGSLESPDPDLPRARRAVRDALLIWAAMVIVILIVNWFLFRLSLVGHTR